MEERVCNRTKNLLGISRSSLHASFRSLIGVSGSIRRFVSGLHLDECGNPMDYDVIWESKEIADCENGDIATLIKRKEVIEFLHNLQKVGKTENVEQESICNKI